MAGQRVIVWQADGMTVRPYPWRERALRQIMRRHRNNIPASLLPAARTPSPAATVGTYRLSTRR